MPEEATYTSGVQVGSSLEDWRGVDIGQIRAQLALPVKDRVSAMVDAANRIVQMQEHATLVRQAKVG